MRSLCRNEEAPPSIFSTVLALAGGLLTAGGPEILKFLMSQVDVSNQLDLKECQTFEESSCLVLVGTLLLAVGDELISGLVGLAYACRYRH